MALKFRDPSQVFDAQIVNTRGLKIGLSAYRAYVEKRLADTYALVDMLFKDEDAESVDLDNTFMTIPVQYEGLGYVAEILLDDARKVVNGLVESANAFRIGAHGIDNRVIAVSADDINQYLSDRIATLQGQSLIFSAALKQNVNSAFDVTQIQSEMAVLGYETSEYLQNVLSIVTSGMSWTDVLYTISSGISKPVKQGISGYWSFEEDEYTGVNSIVLGITAIGNTVASLFENITFDITKVGRFFDALINGVGDLISWLFQMIAGDALADYIVMEDYGLEALDLPIASVTIDLSDDASVGAMETYRSNLQSNSRLKYCFKGTIISSNNEYDQSNYGVGFLPDYSGWIEILSSLVEDQGQVIVPWEHGFIMITRNENVFSCYYFIGEFSSGSGLTHWSVDEDGYVSLLGVTAHYRPIEANEFKNNEQFTNWFKSLFHQTTSGWTLNIGNAFIGFDPADSLYGYFPCVYDFSNIDTPFSIVNACSPFYFSSVTGNVAAQLLMNAIILCDISKSNTPHGTVCITSPYDYSTTIVSDAILEGSLFLPYHENVYPSFKYHAQTDSERTEDMLNLFKRIALTAAAIGIAATSVKLRRQVKINAYRAEVRARDAWRQIESADPEQVDVSSMITSAYRTQRKADIWNRLSSLIGGSTVNGKLSQTMSAFSVGDETDSDVELLYTSITGKRL